eukprot:1183746-Prorocentrum_minimum.AAC.2
MTIKSKDERHKRETEWTTKYERPAWPPPRAGPRGCSRGATQFWMNILPVLLYRQESLEFRLPGGVHVPVVARNPMLDRGIQTVQGKSPRGNTNRCIAAAATLSRCCTYVYALYVCHEIFCF